MTSVQLVGLQHLEVCEITEPPSPGPGEVLVRVRAVGICGSDMHWYQEGCIGAHRAVFPQVLGHEPAGEVADVGKGVNLKPGRRVALEPALTCGRCEYCLAGRHNNCVSSVFMGSPELQGFFREYALVPASNAVPLPEGINFAQATLIEPLAVILHILELTRIGLGETVAVFGAGPIGLLIAVAARIAGASKVFVAERVPHRMRMAEEIGADLAVETGRFHDAVMDVTCGRGVDIVFDAAAKLETINTSFAVARPGGRVVLVGIPSEPDLPVDLHSAMSKELSLQTVKRSNHNAHGAIELLRAGRIPESLITHHFPLEETACAFGMLTNYADGAGKVVIQI